MVCGVGRFMQAALGLWTIWAQKLPGTARAAGWSTKPATCLSSLGHEREEKRKGGERCSADDERRHEAIDDTIPAVPPSIHSSFHPSSNDFLARLQGTTRLEQIMWRRRFRHTSLSSTGNGVVNRACAWACLGNVTKGNPQTSVPSNSYTTKWPILYLSARARCRAPDMSSLAGRRDG